MANSLDYLIVYNSHTGESVKIPKPVRFVSLPKLKDFLSESFSGLAISATDDIFLLTSFGIKLDFSMINELADLYLFDRRLFQKDADRARIQRYLPHSEVRRYAQLKPQEFSFPADLLTLERSEAKELSQALKENAFWAQSLSQNVRQMIELTDTLTRQVNVIFRAFNIIFQFASNFNRSAEKTFESQYNHVKLLSMKSLNQSWGSHYATLEAYPKIQLEDGSSFKLVEFVSKAELSHAAKYVSENLPYVVKSFNKVSATMNEINKERLEVDRIIERHRNESAMTFKNFETSRQQLQHEFEKLWKLLNAEMPTPETASLSELQTTIRQQQDRSKQLYDKSKQIYKLLETAFTFREKLIEESPQIFESIARQQMKTVEVKKNCRQLMQPNEDSINDEPHTLTKVRECEDLLSMTVDLPLLFGFVLIEKRRQYEWHDFFSKGIVANVSDQLSVIIQQEKVFQKLWIKKFGRFIKQVSVKSGVSIQVPALDITLVNSEPRIDSESIFGWLGDIRIERKDLSTYIDNLRNYQFANNVKFSNLLEQNFKDMLVSTDNLKRITQLVASLGSYALSSSSFRPQSHKNTLKNGETTGEIPDLDLIKGFKSRIKKLEDLLHQQQFKNLTSWPVMKSGNTNNSGNRMSLLLSNSRERAVSNPISLLHRSGSSKSITSDLHNFSSDKTLDASITIDKHLDNIRLRKENSEMQKKLSSIMQEHSEAVNNLEEFQNKFKHAQTQCDEMKSKLESSEDRVAELKKLHEGELDELKKRHQDEVQRLSVAKDEILSEREADIAQLKKQINELNDEISSQNACADAEKSLDKELARIKADLEDSKTVNTELLSNMQAKEMEFGTERNDLQRKIKELKFHLEEKTEDFENLMEVIQGKSHRTDELLATSNNMLKVLMTCLCDLLTSNVQYVQDFCLVLESMGLLLVQEPNAETSLPEFRIRRVKGLRSKKEPAEEIKSVKASAVGVLTQGFKWIYEFSNQVSLIQNASVVDEEGSESFHSDELEAVHKQLVTLCDTFLMDKEDGDSNISKFLKLVSFKENVQLQANDSGRPLSEERFFSNGIIKRFNDVEGFAKKLTKENKAKTTELSRALKHSNEKISVKNFQIGDLVLFLPTHIERVDLTEDDKMAITPWTAFNIDAPHYFLDIRSKDSISSEEWLVIRVAKMEQHTVTEENVQDPVENPFALSVGITWYLLSTN